MQVKDCPTRFAGDAELATMDGQLAVVVVLDIEFATAKLAAIDGQLSLVGLTHLITVLGLIAAVNPSVVDHGGAAVGGDHLGASIDIHDAHVLDDIPSRAGDLAALDGHVPVRIIDDRSLSAGVRNNLAGFIRAAVNNGQRTLIGNGVVILSAAAQGKAVQVQRHGFAHGYDDALCRIRRQLDRHRRCAVDLVLQLVLRKHRRHHRQRQHQRQQHRQQPAQFPCLHVHHLVLVLQFSSLNYTNPPHASSTLLS